MYTAELTRNLPENILKSVSGMFSFVVHVVN